MISHSHSQGAKPVHRVITGAPETGSKGNLPPWQDYPLGGTQVEEERLIRQAFDYEPRARLVLDRIGVQPGSSVADIGCGPLPSVRTRRRSTSAARACCWWEPRFAARARVEIARRGLTNVSIVDGDALAMPLKKQSFDLVHERLVMINVSARETLLAEMLSLLRPGGTVVLEEVDNVSWLCQPAHPSWDAILRAFHAVFQADGGDPFVGRRLPELLRAAGVQDIQVAMDVDLALPGEYQRMHLVSLLDSVRERVLSTGLLRDEEASTHREALVAHLSDPATTVIDKLRVQAWGRISK